jgi:8-oxo-dGTP pyrophosphatase MutT (NUDIX family)
LAKLTFDPQSIPVESVAGETGIGMERLDADWLRSRFSNPPEWIPEITDENRARPKNAQPVLASVLVPIVMRDTGPTLLLTQRTAHLNDHAGQVSFPGGRMEAVDSTAVETALRETEEEVGLNRRHVEVIGTLPVYSTITGYLVTPVVSLVHPPFELRADPFEVDEIFEVPLSFLMDGKHHQRRTITIPNETGSRSFYAMPYDRFFIWGATAGMLRNLFHLLRA